MEKTTIELKLKDGKLYWTTDNGSSWGKVDGTYPIMGVNEKYQIVWETYDDSIYGIEIHFHNQDICENKSIKGNGTDRVKVKSKDKIPSPCGDSYTIKIIETEGGTPTEYDPRVTYPKGSAP